MSRFNSRQQHRRKSRFRESPLNKIKLQLFGPDVAFGGWSYAATLPTTNPLTENINEILGLTFNSEMKAYTFTKSTLTKYELVISLKAGNGYAPYYF